VAELADALDSGFQKHRFAALLGITRDIAKTIDFIGDNGDPTKNSNVCGGPRKRGTTSTKTSTAPKPLVRLRILESKK
jgi:hypothetical protein